MISAAIFDLDGTLVDSNDLHVQAGQETFWHFGKEIPVEKLREQIGKGSDQYLPVFLSEKEMREIGKQVDEFRGKINRRSPDELFGWRNSERHLDSPARNRRATNEPILRFLSS